MCVCVFLSQSVTSVCCKGSHKHHCDQDTALSHITKELPAIFFYICPTSNSWQPPSVSHLHNLVASRMLFKYSPQSYNTCLLFHCTVFINLENTIPICQIAIISTIYRPLNQVRFALNTCNSPMRQLLVNCTTAMHKVLLMAPHFICRTLNLIL